MGISAQETIIRAKAIEQKIRGSSHVLAELTPEDLSVKEVEAALQHASVIEKYEHLHRYLPDCLVLIFSKLNEPVHAVIALNESKDYILVDGISANAGGMG